jgi:hypothetical protein
MKRILFLLLVTFNAFYANAQICNNTPTDNKLQTRLDSVVHQLITDIMKRKPVIGISIGIIYNNRTKF